MTYESYSFDVEPQGFVKLVDVMGEDSDIADAARVSYGKGTKSVSDDENLINYLMRHNHTTPFEMVEIKLHIKCPMDVWRQWIRHRTASVNEYSTRYSEAINDTATTEHNCWRKQSQVNRQGSFDNLTEWPEAWRTKDPNILHAPANYNECIVNVLNTTEDKTVGDYLSRREEELLEHSQEVYKERLEAGVAREQARKDLPLSTYTEAYWKCDLHNVFNFLRLRMDSHAQLEIRTYANIIGLDIIAKLFPLAWAAFINYKLHAINLSEKERLAIAYKDLSLFTNKREKEECIEKLKLLNIEFPI